MQRGEMTEEQKEAVLCKIENAVGNPEIFWVAVDQARSEHLRGALELCRLIKALPQPERNRSLDVMIGLKTKRLETKRLEDCQFARRKYVYADKAVGQYVRLYVIHVKHDTPLAKHDANEIWNYMKEKMMWKYRGKSYRLSLDEVLHNDEMRYYAYMLLKNAAMAPYQGHWSFEWSEFLKGPAPPKPELFQPIQPGVGQGRPAKKARIEVD